MGHKGTAFIAITLACISMTAISAHATHATNFLDDFQAAVTNRTATLTNATKAQHQALLSAERALNRNTRTLSADLGALATAATVLNPRFTNDATFTAAETNALASYSGEAHLELAVAQSFLGTNNPSRPVSNQLAQAQAALDIGDNGTNSVPVRARALALALNKLRVTRTMMVRSKLSNFVAPHSMAGHAIVLSEDAVPSDRTTFYFHTLNDYYNYTSDNPEEVGTWTYAASTNRTATIHCAPDYPDSCKTPHDIPLTFTSPITGTFTAQNCDGQQIQGTFVVYDER